MTIIPGQPIDLAKLIEIIDIVNKLNNTVNAATTSSFFLGQDGVLVQESTPKMSMVAASVNLDTTETKADSVSFAYDYSAAKFAKPPVVTATLFEKSASPVVQNHSVVITSITGSQVKGYVKFEASGKFNASINIIAIGYPN
jgi:hypothetical protein